MNKSDRVPTAETLERLLSALDEDRERAAAAYLQLRRKLASFFEWRGAAAPDDCADDVLAVAGRRLAEGEQVRNLSAYCAGIARMLLLEQRRGQPRFVPVDDSYPAEPAEDRASADRLLQCLERCLDELPPESRELMLAYYDRGEKSTIAARKALAVRLGIAPNALRIRAHRIRVRLEASVRALAAQASPPPETD